MELRLDLPVGHDIIPFEEIRQFVRLAELGGAEPSDPVVGVASDDEKNPEALRIAVLGPKEWTPTITIEKELAIRILSLLVDIRGGQPDSGNHLPTVIGLTEELLESMIE
ncbi:hypothetical protein ACTXG6_43450 [Pseudonocardia sp. Cha107L01]|uniref:hypothetical protein n=1 Tax=Pseudonocardia sp. Cha107L01 TaxID=3457576 RepID=UPI00403EB443